MSLRANISGMPHSAAPRVDGPHHSAAGSTWTDAGKGAPINGAAARLVHPGDLVILIAYGQMEDAEARKRAERWGWDLGSANSHQE